MSHKTTKGFSRRRFLGAVGASVVGMHDVAAGTSEAGPKAEVSSRGSLPLGISDGPHSPLFTPIPFAGSTELKNLGSSDFSKTLRDRVKSAPTGQCTCWGIRFLVDRVAVASKETVTLHWPEVRSPWLVCMHTADNEALPRNECGFVTASRGVGRLNERVADYVFLYADGREQRVAIRRRHQLGMLSRPSWGENCFEAVAHQKPFPVRTTCEQPRSGDTWGWAQTRAAQPDSPDWTNWLWAWQNPYPEEGLVGLRIEPKAGVLILSAITVGNVSSTPLRWETRRKAILRLPENQSFEADLTRNGLLKHLQLDLGQVISVLPRKIYPDAEWVDTYNNKPPEVSSEELLVEYTAHPEARFHFPGGQTIPVAELDKAKSGPLSPVAAATQRVKLRIVDKQGKPVAVKLHIHGEAGEYLPPLDRHRIPNPFWYEDWSVDFINPRLHYCTYIPGETQVDLPLGKVFIEISKGFEVAPIRKVLTVNRSTTELNLTVERALRWRERGWVTADTHVHFLSPPSAHLEGAGEGVNVVNLLASQWGELMTNVGDFDGKTTFGSREAGGDGEYLVRIGTENRQHVLGHISLLGYNGSIIAPMTTGGPDEAALGDPVEILLTEWARQCHKQGGLVVLPHFPNPRAEHAAAVISGDIDGVEMTSWSNLYGGIDPYSLSDWYRYLNCGHFVAAVGGTDKMQATTAVGAVRTYAYLPKHRRFDYEAWKAAVRSGHTFVTYGPLLEFAVEGKPPGTRMKVGRTGATVDVTWQVASVTVPMTRVDIVVNGEIRESRQVSPSEDQGHSRLRVDRSSWVALLVRGHYKDKPEIIAAHSSPVMIEIARTPFFSAADSITILEQIEGALAFLDNVGTRADTAAYRRMRMVLLSTHRSLHNRLHQHGVFHEHTPATDHDEHHHQHKA
jgi:hypothetical protein